MTKVNNKKRKKKTKNKKNKKLGKSVLKVNIQPFMSYKHIKTSKERYLLWQNTTYEFSE